MSDIPRWRRAGRALAAWPLLGAILACGAGRDHEPTPPDQVTVVTEPAPAGEVVAEPAPVPDERLGALYFELSGALFEASCEVDDACIGDAPIADEAFREYVRKF